jgi:hypothetical protein
MSPARHDGNGLNPRDRGQPFEDARGNDERALSDELREFERALASLKPGAGRIDRDRLMYLAGQASLVIPPRRLPRAAWLWPAATVCSAAVGLVLGLALAAPRNETLARHAADRAATVVDAKPAELGAQAPVGAERSPNAAASASPPSYEGVSIFQASSLLALRQGRLPGVAETEPSPRWSPPDRRSELPPPAVYQQLRRQWLDGSFDNHL